MSQKRSQATPESDADIEAEIDRLLAEAENPAPPTPSGPAAPQFACTIDGQPDGSALLRRNPAGHSEQVVNLVHRANVEAAPYHALLKACGPVVQQSAIDYVEQYLAEMQPRNPAERMLAVQILWQHARIARLTTAAAHEDRYTNIKALGLLIDSAMAVSRRQVQTWQELRTPRPVQIIKGQQVNMADRQVIAHSTGSKSVDEANSSNKQGCHDERESAPALPAQPEWAGFATGNGAAREAVAVEHRAANARR